jgi:xylulokinase
MHSGEMKFVLGIDVGTTSVKSVLLNGKGDLLASVMKEYSLDSGPNDTCEVHPDVYWKITCQVIRELLVVSKVNPEMVKALAFSSQGETLIVVDADGNPIRKAIVWLDNRSTNEAREIEDKFGSQLIMEMTGQPEVVPTWPATRILWLKKNEPETFRRAYKYLLVEDYLLYKMTGEYHTEHSLVSSTLFFDISKKVWWPEMLEFIGISASQLPVINQSGIPVGSLTVEAAKETGLNLNTQCVTGAYDHPAGAIGAGSIHSGDVTLTIGGSMAMCVSMDKPVADLALKLPCQCHAVDGLYFLLPYGQTAGMVLRWFRDEFCGNEIRKARKKGLDVYDLIVEKAAKIAPGADGLIMLPHLMGAGSPEFNPEAKGVFAGIKMGMTKAHFTRAILESVVFMINRNIQIMKEQGIVIRDIRVLGGGSKSTLWVKILADMTGIPVHTLSISDNAATGAALLAGVGIGFFDDLNESCQISVKSQTRIDPDMQTHEQYKTFYNKYLQLYQSLELFW